MDTKKSKDCIMQYVIFTYGLFGLLLLTLGGIATVLLHGTPSVMRWLTAITAWTPTFVLLLMFKKLYPNCTVKAFYKKAFDAKLNFRLLVTTTIIQIFIFASSVYIISVQRSVTVISLFDFSFSTVIPALFFTLIQGATGEESGWRGYLLPAIEGKIGIIKSSLAVSLIWSFWHAPIWFLGTGYTGTELIKYIIAFVICITSLGFIIGICYHHCKNLFVPIWIHFLFNFLGETYTGSMADLVAWYAAFYLIIAIGFFLWHKRSQKTSKEITAKKSIAQPNV
ncbi:MAG: CAAX amino terminal protease self- immunity [Firmicutes bacterium ADurb.Bin182]|nr:MAG: CAAX amino terminal protease self- immunity [Firmicutes bacterium ADurb.Bin182]